MTTTVRLGARVRDRSTGFSGIAVGRKQTYGQATRILIQGDLTKDGAIGEAFWADEFLLLEVEGDNILDLVTELEPNEHEIRLGTPIIDLITGLSGIAVQRHESMNGCLSFALQAPYSETDEGAGQMFSPMEFPVKRLLPVEIAGAAETIPDGDSKTGASAATREPRRGVVR